MLFATTGSSELVHVVRFLLSYKRDLSQVGKTGLSSYLLQVMDSAHSVLVLDSRRSHSLNLSPLLIVIDSVIAVASFPSHSLNLLPVLATILLVSALISHPSHCHTVW